LYRQVPNPVRWIQVIQKLSSLGVGRFVEVGAGGVLTGLLRNIGGDGEGSKFGEAEDLEKVHAAIA
jgi:[acyl-carrier-protein] S-malonyltransferase